MTALREFNLQVHSRARGRVAEQDGVRWLESQGLELVARNVLFRTGEIDVVGREGDTLCFIEIKARRHGEFGGAAEAVTLRKQRQIGAAALLYLQRNPYSGPCRFDVLAMDGERNRWRYTWIRGAFELPTP